MVTIPFPSLQLGEQIEGLDSKHDNATSGYQEAGYYLPTLNQTWLLESPK